MGQDQSKGEELFRSNPKFQRTDSRGHSSTSANVQCQVTGLNKTSSRTDVDPSLTRSEGTDSRGHSSSSANAQYQVTSLNETSPKTDAVPSLAGSERTDSIGHGTSSANAPYQVTGLNETSPKTDADPNLTRSERTDSRGHSSSSANAQYQLTGLNETSPKNRAAPSLIISERTDSRELGFSSANFQYQATGLNETNPKIGAAPSLTRSESTDSREHGFSSANSQYLVTGLNKTSPKTDAAPINTAREFETSPKRQTQQVQNNNSPSKTAFSNLKFKPPERDVRHVPTYNEQIRLSSTVTGNPFLSTPDTKSEYLKNESVEQINRHQRYVSNKVEKSLVEEKLENMYCLGIISQYDLDENARKSLERLPIDLALDILNQFALSNPKTKLNKSAYLCSMIKNRTNPPSSQKDSVNYFASANSSNYDFANTFCDVNKDEIKVTKQVSSPIHLLPKELTGDNLFPSKDQSSSGSDSVKYTLTTNASHTRISEPSKEDILSSVNSEKLLSYEDNLNIKSEHSPGENPVSEQNVRQRKQLAPRFQQQKMFKKNLLKGVGSISQSAKTSTQNVIKDIEKLAEIYSFKKCSAANEKTLVKGSISANSVVDVQNKHPTPSFEECILQMTNIEIQPKDSLTSLQQGIGSNLEIINNFISVLKTFPYMSEEINSQVNKLIENVMSFPVDMNCSSENPNHCVSLSPSEASVNKSDYIHLWGKQSKSNFLSTPSSVTVENTAQAKCTFNIGITPLNSLDDLPHKYESEKKNISLNGNNLFCKICNISIEFNLLSLINHFKSIGHQKYLNITNSLPKQMEFSRDQLFGKTETKESVSETRKNDEDELALGKNHQGILEVVYTSCMNSFVIDKTYYICVFCDFWASEIVNAMNHVELDKMHINQQIKNANWHTCNSCGIVIYATEKNFRDHCSSVLHCNIMEVKRKSLNDKDVLKTDEKEEDRDDISVCSSKGDPSHAHKTPHEILLSFAKKFKDRKNLNGTIGLYCRVCNRYVRYDRLKPDADRSKRHMVDHRERNRGNRNNKILHCSTCNIDLIGDNSLWQEHEAMELHKELACKDGDAKQLDNESNDNPNVSHELPIEGPHFNLMRVVLKSHVMNESAKDMLGYYCHLCQIHTLEENQWRTHLTSASHSNRINTSECMNRKMWHNCSVCNISLICSEHIFILHEQSWGHEAVSKLHQSRRDQRGAVASPLTKRENDEASDNESEDTEDESEDEEDNDSQSTTSSKNTNNENNTTVVARGIKVAGLPPNVVQRELFETFKIFGYINSCKILKSGKSGVIMFRDKEIIKSVLEEKDLTIRGKKIIVFPLVRGNRSRKSAVEVMNTSVMEILNSKETLNRLMKGLKAEISEISRQRADTSTQIMQDILKAVPGCKVHIFGSQYTGLALRDSDCDIYIDHDGRSYFTELSQSQQETIINGLLQKLTFPNSGFRVCDPVMKARVPILPVIHNRTNIPCDISCRSGLSMENSILTRQLLCSDFRVNWLVIFIKWWMNANDLLGSSKFTSYTTTWLVLFYLMRVQPSILSSVVEMKEGCPQYSIGFWDCRFNRDFKPSRRSQNRDSQHKLLVEFFRFYGSFNFGSIVLCPLTANLIPRKQFDELKVPPAYHPYVQKIRTVPDAERLRTVTPICLQDPFDLSHNIAKGVSSKDLKKFKKFCCVSHKICITSGSF